MLFAVSHSKPMMMWSIHNNKILGIGGSKALCLVFITSHFGATTSQKGKKRGKDDRRQENLFGSKI